MPDVRSRTAAEAEVSARIFALVTAEAQRTESDPAYQPQGAWLPMPTPEGAVRKVSLIEWLEHEKRQALHATDQPGYGKGFWNRVTPETAAQIWDLLAVPMGLTLSELWAPWPDLWEPTAAEQTALTVRTQQAAATVLATIANLGKDHRLLTVNAVAGALYEGWSDHWREIKEAGRASVVFHLAPASVRACHRDLQRWRISPERLWEHLVQRSARKGADNPLFYLERAVQPEADEDMPLVGEEGEPRQERGKPSGAYVVRLRDPWSQDWKRFESALLRDAQRGAPCYVNPYGRFPILTVATPHKPIVRREILAEQAFNVAAYGTETERVLKLLEGSVQLLDVAAFRRDYEHAVEIQHEIEQMLKRRGLPKSVLSTHKRRVRNVLQRRTIRDHALSVAVEKGLIISEERAEIESELARYDSALWITRSFGKAYQQTATMVQPPMGAGSLLSVLKGTMTPWSPGRPLWKIRSHFTKSLNRRYTPLHFHLSSITKDPWADAEASQLSPGAITRSALFGVDEELEKGLRFRWIKAPALPRAGESAQELVGLDVKSSQTQIIALFAGLRGLEASFANGGDFRKDSLIPAAMAHVRPGYSGPDDPRLGALIKNTVMTRFYGSKFPELVKKQHADPAGFGPGWIDYHHADAALDAMPDREGLERFLMATRRMALVAFRADGRATLTDLLDAQCPGGGRFTWDPHPFQEQKVAVGHGLSVTVGAPKLNKSGELSLPSIRAKVQNLLGPCWVHMADSYYLSLVVTRLAAGGVQAFGTVHDCLTVPAQILARDGSVAPGLQVLKREMDVAAAEWFRGLGPMYADLIRYLGEDDTIIPKPKGWRGEWAKETFSRYAHRLREQWLARVTACEASAEPWPVFAVSSK